jgi:tetratricopeptide (TPR) repeat protein
MEVLVVLARQAGRTVSRDQLIDACWGGRIVSDDAVNRVLAQVRALARLQDPPPFVLETVPKVGVRLIPGAAAPASEPSPASVSPGAAPHAPAAAPRQRRGPSRPHLLAAGGVLLLLLVAGLFIWRGLAPSGARPPGQNGHVQVMQFTAAGDDPVVAATARAVPETLLRILSNGGVPTAREPARPDEGQGDAELRIAGSVEREGPQVAINSQIIDRRSGLVLWTDRFVRAESEVQASPGEVADSIAGALGCALADRKLARSTISTEAFGLYIDTCASVGAPDEQMVASARRLVSAAPRYGPAHAMLAIATARMATNRQVSPAVVQAMHAEADREATLALKLDPRAAKAYSALAINGGVFRDDQIRNWSRIEGYLTKALAIDPTLAPARNEYSTLLRATGRLREAVEFVKASNAYQDPRYAGDPRVAMLMASAGDFAGAQAELQRLQARQRVSYQDVRWAIAFWWGDPKAAAAEPVLSRGSAKPECFTTYLQGLIAHRAMKGLPSSCAGLDEYWRVRMLAREGDLDGAFAAFDSPIRGGTVLFYYPEMKAFRADPRFWPLVRRIGLLDYWRKSGHWPDFCAEPGMDCRKAAAQASA